MLPAPVPGLTPRDPRVSRRDSPDPDSCGSLGSLSPCLTFRPRAGGDAGWADSEADSSCAGQPIHLWQFLKELLLKPHNYGRFIRWLNKEKGGRVGAPVALWRVLGGQVRL